MNAAVATTNQRQLSNNQPKFSVFMNQEQIKGLVSQAVGKNAQRFTASIISAVSTNPTLEKCTQKSILSGALLGESLGLSPSPQLGQYYLVPFDKKDRQGNVIETNAQFVLGAKGYKQLAMRSGQYLDIDVFEIKEGEYIGAFLVSPLGAGAWDSWANSNEITMTYYNGNWYLSSEV